MIHVRISKGDGYLRLEMEGHAGAGPKGADIVCAAVSAIAETAVMGLAEVARQYPEHVRMSLAPRNDSDSAIFVPAELITARGLWQVGTTAAE